MPACGKRNAAPPWTPSRHPPRTTSKPCCGRSNKVADILQALAHDEKLEASQNRALAAASEAVRLQRINYANGGTGLLNLLDAQRQYQQAELGSIRARAQHYQDTIQLLVAMGGGWWDARLVRKEDGTKRRGRETIQASTAKRREVGPDKHGEKFVSFAGRFAPEFRDRVPAHQGSGAGSRASISQKYRRSPRVPPRPPAASVSAAMPETVIAAA